MKRRLTAMLIGLGMILAVAVPASASPPPAPTAVATFDLSEYWIDNYWSVPAPVPYMYYNDATEFLVNDKFYGTRYASIVGNQFRLRAPSYSTQPTVYTNELNYYTGIPYLDWYYDKVTLQNGEFVHEGQVSGVTSITLLTYRSNYVVFTDLTLTGWKDVTPPYTKFYSVGVTSGIKVTLKATDDISGVKSTEYRIDGGSWTPYSAPFILSPGTGSTVEYRSTDQVDNVEPIHLIKL